MQTNDQIYYTLGLLGYSGTIDDRIYKYLGDQGYLGALNDRLRRFFFSLGYVGTFTDQYAQWRKAGYVLFEPNLLFVNGEVGTWFDPSDVSLNWRRNLLTYTEQFDNAAWVKTNVTVTPNTEIAPDGTLTADTIQFSQIFAHIRTQASVLVLGTQYTLSIYVKVASGTRIYYWFDNTGNNIGSFEATTEWKRYSVTFTALATTALFVIQDRNASGFVDTYVWGAQLEVGDTATDYQRIVTPEITYVADVQPLPILYQDAAGTTPVTAVEQPVSLMLDKSANLAIGEELVTTSSINGVPIGGPTVTTYTTGASVVAGKLYKVTFTVSNYSGTGDVGVGGSSFGAPVLRASANGNYSFNAIATGSTLFEFFTRSTNTANFTNISAKEIAGNHAYTPSTASTSRPTLSARYNLLTYSEQFDNAAWVKTAVNVTANAAVAPNGTLTADALIEDTALSAHEARQFAPVVGLTYSLSFYVKAITSGRYLSITGFGAAAVSEAVVFNPDNGTVDLGATTTVVKSAFISQESNGWYRCSLVFVPANTSTVSFLLTNDATNNTAPSYTGNGTSGVYIWGADLRVSNDGTSLPTYQRVTTSTDYDTVNFPPYLRFDGSDDYMLTNSIDFTGTDKMTVFAGVRKLSDATFAVVAELSATTASNNGTFILQAPATTTTNRFAFISKGTSLASAVISGTDYDAPTTKAISGIGNISGDIVTLRVNGTEVATSSADQGTGNYGNYPLYIGRRGGTSNPFNGRLYGLITRGAQSTASEISNTEAWLNAKTKAYA